MLRLNNMFKDIKEDTWTTSNDVVLVSLLLTLTSFPYFSSVFYWWLWAGNCLSWYYIYHFKFWFYDQQSMLIYLFFKGTATDMRYSARIKFSRSLVHRKNFSLIWRVVFKLGYVLCQERSDTSSEFEWTLRKVASDNNSR